MEALRVQPLGLLQGDWYLVVPAQVDQVGHRPVGQHTGQQAARLFPSFFFSLIHAHQVDLQRGVLPKERLLQCCRWQSLRLRLVEP